MSIEQIKNVFVTLFAITVLFPVLMTAANTIEGWQKFRRDGWAYFVPRWSHVIGGFSHLLIASPFAVGIYLESIGVSVNPWTVSPMIVIAIGSLIPLIRLEEWIEETTGREKVLTAAEKRCKSEVGSLRYNDK